MPWKQRECRGRFIGPSIGVVFGSRRSATLRCGWMSVVTCTREDTHGDVYAEGGGRNPSRITRIEARGRVSSRLLETSQVRRATAGSRANLHEHACDAKWVMCPCRRDGCFGQRECAGRRRSPAFTRQEPAGKQRAPTQGTVQETVKKHGVPPVTTAVASVVKQQLLRNIMVTLHK